MKAIEALTQMMAVTASDEIIMLAAFEVDDVLSFCAEEFAVDIETAASAVWISRKV